MTVVEEIMGGVLGGVIFLILTYFLFGYYLYASDMEAYEKLMDERELDAENPGSSSGNEEADGADPKETDALNPMHNKSKPTEPRAQNERLKLPRGDYFQGDALPRPVQKFVDEEPPDHRQESAEKATVGSVYSSTKVNVPPARLSPSPAPDSVQRDVGNPSPDTAPTPPIAGGDKKAV